MKLQLKLRLPISIFALLLFSSLQCLAQNSQPSDPLVVLNNAFRAEYSRAKTDALSKIGPLIMVEGNKVILQRKGQRTEAEIVPPIYSSLKAIAHIPFAVFLIFGQTGSDSLSDTRIVELQDYRKLIVAARDSLGSRGFTDTQLQRQQKIIGQSLEFFDSVIKKKSVEREELDAFAKRMRSLLLANVEEAARAELDALHSAVTKWRQAMSSDEWTNLHVVVISAHMPREGEITMQYFQRLLKEPVEGNRIIFAEGLWEEQKAIDLLGTHLIDGRAGEAFFGEFMRMHRDLLSDAAKAYLSKMKFE